MAIDGADKKKQVLVQWWSLHQRAAIICISSSLLLKEHQQFARRSPAQAGICKPRITVRKRNREHATFTQVTSALSENEFKLIYRMRRGDFEKLLELARWDLKREGDMGNRSGNDVINPDVRLGVTIRMLAGGQYEDVMQIFRIGRSTVYTIFHVTAKALLSKLKMPLILNSDHGLEELSKGFKASRSKTNPLAGCIGALDGICIKIDKPPDDMNPALFYSRKGFYAIPVQALVDHNYRFLCASANCVGSTHDSLAFSSIKLGMYLENGLLNLKYWIAGDEAYVCTESLLTPFPSTQLTTYRDSFNFFLSSMCMHVEQAFGMLKAKWRILNNLKFPALVCSSIILLTMKLHNYCIDQKLSRNGIFRLSSKRKTEIEEESNEWYIIAKEVELERIAVLRESLEANFVDTCSAKREKFVALLEAKGIVRSNMTYHDQNLRLVMERVYHGK